MRINQKILIVLIILALFGSLNCENGNPTNSSIPRTYFTIDNVSHNTLMTQYGNTNMMWGRASFTFSYHYNIYAGTIERISFYYNKDSSGTSYREFSPDSSGIIQQREIDFWIPDSLIGVDSLTITYQINGSLWFNVSSDSLVDSFTFMDSVRTKIQR